jgi:hypothetical protein
LRGLAVLWLVKWVFVAVAVLAIVTAEPEQQLAMYRGAEAFGYAVVSACRRPNSPCTKAVSSVEAVVAPIWSRTNIGKSETTDQQGFYYDRIPFDN